MENKVSENINESISTDINVGLVKIEKEEVSDLNIIENMELQWEQKTHHQKPFHRGKRTISWREAEVNYLIDLVKSNSYVWNTAVPDFKTKHKKSLFWDVAADKINNALHPRIPFTRNDCFKKWNNLRTYFMAEMKVKNSGVTSDGEEIVGRGWKYSSKMSFLIGARSPQLPANTLNNNDSSAFETTNSLSDGESEMEASERSALLSTELLDNDCNHSIANMDDLQQSPPVSPPPKRKKISDLSDATRNTLIPNNLNGLASPNESQLPRAEEMRSHFYCKYIGQCLDMLDPDLNLEAREKINEILFKYEKVQLKRS